MFRDFIFVESLGSPYALRMALPYVVKAVKKLQASVDGGL